MEVFRVLCLNKARTSLRVTNLKFTRGISSRGSIKKNNNKNQEIQILRMEAKECGVNLKD